MLSFNTPQIILLIILLFIIIYLFINTYINHKFKTLIQEEDFSYLTTQNNDNTDNDNTDNDNTDNDNNNNYNEMNTINTEYTKNNYEINQNNINSNENLFLDRIYNPIERQYRNNTFYDQQFYPNLQLPAQVIGCGARNTPCLGGTQVPIANPMSPINISDANISPNNISNIMKPMPEQQVGVLYQIFGNYNQVLPLYGRQKYLYGSRWQYHTFLDGIRMQLITKHNNDDVLGNNDVVFLRGVPDRAYRVTIYENNYPQYVPFI